MADKKLYDANDQEIKINAKPQLYDANDLPIQSVGETDPSGRAVVTRGKDGQESTRLERTDTLKGKQAPYAGRATAEMLPLIGSVAGVGGTLAGTGAMLAAKKYDPETFGQYNPDIMDQMGETLKQLTIQHLVPGIMGKLGELGMAGYKAGVSKKNLAIKTLQDFPAIRDARLRETFMPQVMNKVFPESSIVEQGGVNAANYHKELVDNILAAQKEFPDLPPSKSLEIINGVPQVIEKAGGKSPEVLAAESKLGDVYGQNKVGGMLRKINQEADNFNRGAAASTAVKDVTRETLRDKKMVENALLTGGQNYTHDIAVNQIVAHAGNPVEGTIDAKKALDLIGGDKEEIYKTAMGPGYDKFKSLLETMKGLQDKNNIDNILSFSGRRLMWNMLGGGSMLHFGLGVSPILGAAAGAAKAEAPVITNWMLGKAMRNPQAVQLLELALKTPKSSPQAPFVQKLLTEILPRVIQSEAALAATPDR